MTGTKEYVSAVNDVIAICKDAQQGFQGAANAVKDQKLKTLFQEYSNQRGAFASELQAAVRNLGDEPREPAGVPGALHRGWIALKGAVTGHSEHEILEETERGEDLSVKTYREALGKTLPDQILVIVQSQFEQVQEAHRHIRELRDQTA